MLFVCGIMGSFFVLRDAELHCSQLSDLNGWSKTALAVLKDNS
jgi:hypothetical protein